MSQDEWQPEPELQNSLIPRRVAKRYPVPLFWRLFFPSAIMIFLIFTNWTIIKQEYITRYGNPATGIVQDKEALLKHGSSIRYRYRLTVSYQTSSGDKVVDTFTSSRWEYDCHKVGDSIELMLDPSNPREARILSTKGQGLIYFFLEIAAVMLVYIGINILRKKFNKHRKIVSNGQAIWGVIKEVRSSETPTKVIVDYKIGGTYYQNKIHVLMYPQDYREGEYITLLVNTNNPEEFVVYPSASYKAL